MPNALQRAIAPPRNALTDAIKQASSGAGSSSTPQGAAGGRGHGGRGEGSSATPAENVAVAKVTPIQETTSGNAATQFQLRQQQIANIRAGNVPNVAVKGSMIVNTQTGQRVGVRGNIIYNTRTGEIMNAPDSTDTSSSNTYQTISGGSDSMAQMVNIGASRGSSNDKVLTQQEYITKLKTAERYIGSSGGFDLYTPQKQPTDTGTFQNIKIISPMEVAERDVITNKVAAFTFGTTYSGNLLTTDLNTLRSNIKQAALISTDLASRNKQIELLGKDNIKDNQWIGTTEDLAKYNVAVEQYQNKQTTFEGMNNLKAGLFGLTKDVPLSDLSNLRFGTPLVTTTTILGKTMGATLGVGLEKGSRALGLPEQGIYSFTTPEKNVTMSLNYQTRGTSFYKTPEVSVYNPNLSTAQSRVFYNQQGTFVAPTTQVTIAPKTYSIINPVQLRKVGEFTGEVSPYLNPLGGYIFFGQAAEKLGGNIMENKQYTTPTICNMETNIASRGTTKLNLLGTAWAGTKAYVKSNPFEVVALATIGALKIKGTYNKATGTGANKYDKYLKQAEAKSISLRQKTIENVIKDSNVVPKVEIVKETLYDKTIERLNFFGKEKGVTKVTESYGTDIASGGGAEIRNMKSGEGFFNKLFGGKDKFKTFKVTAQQEGNKFYEVIKYDKGIKKISLTNLDTGKTVIKLVDKKGNLLKMVEGESELSAGLKGITKKTTNKVNIDEQIRNPLTITETSLGKGKNKLNARTIQDQSSKDIVFGDVNANLKSTKIFGEFETNIKRVSNKERGIVITESRGTGFSDVITSGARKGQVVERRGDVFIKVNKRASQEIVYGNPNEKDIVKRIVGGDKSSTLRKISPTTNREIMQLAQTDINYLYVNPSSKLLNKVGDVSSIKKPYLQKLYGNTGGRLIKPVRGGEQRAEAYQRLIDERNSGIGTLMMNKLKNIKMMSNTEGTISQTEVPLMVGGKGGISSESAYDFANIKDALGNAPKLNLVEEVVVFPTSKYLKPISSTAINMPISTDISISKMGVGLKYGVVNLMDRQLKTDVLTTQLNQIKTAQDNKIETRMKNDFKQDIMLEQSMSLNLQLKTDTAQQQKQEKQQQKQQTQSQRQREIQTPKEEIFKIIPPPPVSSWDSILSFPKASKKKRAIFEALSRRKGKEFSLGTYESQSQAESVLGKYLKSTLAASGRIKSQGRALSFGELKTLRGRGFTSGKRDLFKVVQARGFRLDSGSERMEIKRAKKAKRFKVW